MKDEVENYKLIETLNHKKNRKSALRAKKKYN